MTVEAAAAAAVAAESVLIELVAAGRVTFTRSGYRIALYKIIYNK